MRIARVDGPPLDPSARPGAGPALAADGTADGAADLVLPFARLDAGDSVGNLLRRHECTAVALSPAPDAVDIAQVSVAQGKVALLLGSERAGLTSDAMAASSIVVRIPMYHGIDSLNVAAAAAIALHALGPGTTT